MSGGVGRKVAAAEATKLFTKGMQQTIASALYLASSTRNCSVSLASLNEASTRPSVCQDEIHFARLYE